MEQKAEKLERPVVAALDEVLGVPFKVLDDGFVRVVDYMGSDESIVQAARVSYGRGTKKVNEDRGLIRYLLRHSHTTPFEMCEIKLHLRVPMDCWRQWIRHRTANINEYSTRYSLAIDASQRTPPGEWRQQSKDNKQGSEGFVDLTLGEGLTKQEQELQDYVRKVYNERVEKGIAREQARKIFPYQHTLRHTGRSICTICSTSSSCGWIIMRNLRFDRMRMSSATRLSDAGARSCGKRSSTIVSAAPL